MLSLPLITSRMSYWHLRCHKICKLNFLCCWYNAVQTKFFKGLFDYQLRQKQSVVHFHRYFFSYLRCRPSGRPKCSGVYGIKLTCFSICYPFIFARRIMATSRLRPYDTCLSSASESGITENRIKEIWSLYSKLQTNLQCDSSHYSITLKRNTHVSIEPHVGGCFAGDLYRWLIIAIHRHYYAYFLILW